MPISLLDGAGGLAPFLSPPRINQQTYVPPPVADFGGGSFSAPQSLAQSYGGAPPAIGSPVAPIATSPFFATPQGGQMGDSFAGISSSIMAPPSASMQSFGPTGQQGGFVAAPPKLPDFSLSSLKSPYPDTPQATAPSSGTSANLGGDWAGVEQWSAQINAAAAKYGLDPNQIKALMKEESNGDPNASGAPGVWGPMQVNSGAWGNGPWMSDASANIDKGAQILKSYLDQNGGDFYQALRGYHGYGSDGNTTDTQYADIVTGFYKQLQSSPAPGSGSQAGGGLANLFGAGANVQDWGAFNVPSSNGLYGYGTDYGLNGTNHTGEDVVVPYGTPYKAAFSGRVVCAGTGNGDGTDSCAAFQDMIGGGAGRVEIMSDDGNTILIYGHSSKSFFQAGQHVAAGQTLGASGGENSPHVHVEARVRDNSTPSGWRIVDPTPYINGGAFTGSSGSTAAAPAQVPAWLQAPAWATVGRAPAGSSTLQANPLNAAYAFLGSR